MFSSDMGKIIELQGQYIDRVNRNATKLNKQLQFLVNIGEQIGGATQKDEATHTTIINELNKQDEAISKAMADQKIKTDKLSESIKSIIESYATLKTSSGDSSTKVTELMAYLNKLKDSNTQKLTELNNVTEKLDDEGIKKALQNSSSNTVEPKSVDTKQATNATNSTNATASTNAKLGTSANSGAKPVTSANSGTKSGTRK